MEEQKQPIRVKKKLPLWAVCLITGLLTAVLCAGVLGVLLHYLHSDNPRPTEPSFTVTEPSAVPTTAPTQPSTEPTTEPTEPTTEPTEPPIVKESTATIAAVGDILPHMPILRSYYDASTDVYDFNPIFEHFRSYIEDADYAIANLETTLGGLGNGFNYMAYPGFNTPDSIADALKNAGFDMLLTANNHSYDTRTKGMLRTLQMLNERSLEHLGTKETPEESDFIIKEINGIRIGMVCYTYETPNNTTDRKSLNGIMLTPEASQLVVSYDNQDLPAFYAHAQATLEAMKAAGADATVFFMHWGPKEYVLKPVKQHVEMAQTLCDLGVDVIVGGHPHVIQPVDLLTSQTNPGHKTVCLYSLGNSLSNQRKWAMDMKSGHTEDGLLVNMTFSRYSDGTVILESVELMPTWVDMIYVEGDIRSYTVYALDKEIEDWKSHYNLSGDSMWQFNESYQRTMELIGEGQTKIQEYLTQRQAEVEKELGITEG